MATKRTKRKPGNPTLYDPEVHPDRVRKLCLLGLIDQDIAEVFEINVVTHYAWKKRHAEYAKAIKEGKDQADSEVAKSMYKRATGFTVPEEKIFCSRDGEVIRVQTNHYYPPNVTAAIFWLKNRQKDIWRDVQRHEHSGKDGTPIEHRVRVSRLDLSDFTQAELDLLDKFGALDKEKDSDGPTSPK